MKKKDSGGLGMTIPKRMRIAKRSNMLPQFIQRQKMQHTTALERAADSYGGLTGTP